MYRNLVDGIGLGVFMLIGAAFGFCLSPAPLGGPYKVQTHLLQAAIVFGGAIAGGMVWKLRHWGAPKSPEEN